MFFYVFAVLLTAGLNYYSSDLSPFVIVVLTSIGGFGALVLGYASVIILGGKISLQLTEFISRFDKSRHVIEVIDEKPRTIRHAVSRQDFILYMPALVFILSLFLAWDIHNVHPKQSSIFHPLLHALDIFSKPIGVSPTSYSADVIPAMLVLIAIAGIIPSMVLPYFRRFKITGVNSGPFHTNLLLIVMGLIVGLGSLLTLVGFIYRVLWVSKGPSYYYFTLLAMPGLSLHYAIGTFLGRDKAENMVMTQLRASSRKRIHRGTVIVQRPPE